MRQTGQSRQRIHLLLGCCMFPHPAAPHACGGHDGSASWVQERYPEEMVAAVNDVAQARLAEGLQLKAAGHERWWRLREATLAALSTQLGRGLLDDGDSDGGDGRARGGRGGAFPVPEGLDVRAILSSVLEHDLQPRDTPPFLRGRALWVAAKLASALPEVRGLCMGSRVPVLACLLDLGGC